ncbi:hypothetical protein GF362_01045 [Candidatus Dojkabacteria bacterium]|nr:hypothetical protein [Candidatus Dojkabacteria bacterium]
MEDSPWRPTDCSLETELPTLLGFAPERLKYIDNGTNGGPIVFKIPPTGPEAREGGLRTGAQLTADILLTCMRCGGCMPSFLSSETPIERTVTITRTRKE